MEGKLSDLVTRLTDAVAAAIANSGTVVDATCYVERKYVFRPRKEPAA